MNSGIEELEADLSACFIEWMFALFPDLWYDKTNLWI